MTSKAKTPEKKIKDFDWLDYDVRLKSIEKAIAANFVSENNLLSVIDKIYNFLKEGAVRQL